jgi:hypothetical protein
MERRHFTTAASAMVVVALAVGAFAAARTTGTAPATVTGETLPVGETTTYAPPPTTAAPLGTVVEVTPTEPDNAQEAVTRIQTTGAVKSEDLRLILLDAASYDMALKPFIGAGTITDEGPAVPQSLLSSLVAGLSTPAGYAREWSNDAGTYKILEEALAFKNAAEASEYTKRYVTQARAAKIPEVPQTSTRTEYLAEFDTREKPFPCRSIAVLKHDRLVVTATVFRADCKVSTAVWSAKLGDAAIQIARTGLGQ